MKRIYFIIIFVSGILAVATGFIFLKLNSPLNSQKIQQTKVFIDPSFPQALTYERYFESQNDLIVQSSAMADLAIAKISPWKYNSKITIYTKILSLVQDFKAYPDTITNADYVSLLQDQSHIAIDNSVASFIPAIKNEATDPLAFVQQDLHNYAVIDFTSLTNRYRSIYIDGNSPIQKNFNLDNYPLAITYAVFTKSALPAKDMKYIIGHSYTNYDPKNIHTIIMTGTTAMARGVYFRINTYGTQYPAQYVAPIMKTGDIVHVSNEVSFSSDCTQQVGTLTFCSYPNFIKTLQYAGVNLVELTGNHNNDWGTQADFDSLKIYDANGIKHFGGGVNATAARFPAIFDLGGITFAFLGYNEPGPAAAFATPTTPGAAKLDVNTMVQDIQNAKKIADVVFVDVQWENENNLEASDSQVTISKAAIDAGADVVTGSQAHRPQGIMFYNNKTVFFGLGNLFFDQMEVPEKRQNDIVRHTFYGKNLISSELIPTLLYDYAQPRPVNGSDAQAILDEVFSASINVH